MEDQVQSSLIVKTFPVGPLQCNCTLIGNPHSGQAILIDPGGDSEMYIPRPRISVEHGQLEIFLQHVVVETFAYAIAYAIAYASLRQAYADRRAPQLLPRH